MSATGFRASKRKWDYIPEYALAQTPRYTSYPPANRFIADVDAITVRYEHPLKLLADLRGMGETNVLTQRRRSFLKRRVLGRAFEIYGETFRGADGRVPATFEIVYLTGWSPAKKPT